MLLYQLYGQFVQNASRCYLKKRKDVGGQVDGKFVERCGLNTVSELVKASLCSSLTFHPPSLKEHRLLVLRHRSPHLLSVPPVPQSSDVIKDILHLSGTNGQV